MSVLFNIADGVARVTIDRPERMNAIDAETEAELERIWSEIENNASIRCVVLTGAGERAFCAGADMKSSSGKSGLEYWASANPNGFGGISLRRSMNIPVIARVNGMALGGGMEMVLGCDIVIASEQASFGLPEAKVGRLPLDGGMVLLPRLIPEKIAVGLMITGHRLSSSDAAQYGLVNSVVSSGTLDQEVDKWVNDIVSCAPLSVAAIKDIVHSSRQLPVNEAQGLRTASLVTALTSKDSDEGVAAFIEKRDPVWQGC